MEERMKRLFYALMGTVIGAVIGSSLALLFAPVSGEEARERLTGYFTNIGEEMARAGQEKRAELEAQLNKLRSGKEA